MGLLSRNCWVYPSDSASGQPCTAAPTTSAPESQQKDLGRLHRAAARGHLAWLKRWRWWVKMVGINSCDGENRTPLHLACANGHMDVVRFLVRHNCQLNLTDNLGRSPLMEAVQCQQEQCVGFLLKRGADPGLADADGNTALHLAVLAHNINIVRLLIKHKAKLDAKNKEGSTPLTLSISEEQLEIQLLLRVAAALRTRDEQKSKQLAEGAEQNTGEASAGDGEDVAILITPHQARSATDRGGEHLGSTCHVSPSDEKEKLKNAIENSGVQESDTERVKDLLHRNLLLVEEISMLREELEEVRQRHEDEEWKYLEENVTLEEKNEQLSKELKHCEESMQEQLAQLQHENLLLHQQLEDMQKKQNFRENIRNEEQDCCKDKVEREGMVKQKQQELANALEKLLMTDTTHHEKELEEAKLALKKELEEVKTKCRELKEQQLQSYHQVQDWKIVFENTRGELRENSNKMQNLLSTYCRTINSTIKHQEELVQRLETENLQLAVTVQQQRRRIKALQKQLQASTSRESERKKVKDPEKKHPVKLHRKRERGNNMEVQKKCERD
ncbi:ankyrin repeat domain-containing protein 18B-like isoform X1 [Heliangelus exortis]|uniref:ankyrin repeat domain-containing protein 18B-like isoform X1 n=1 Tax=Heliangelus exortis TaxID=472823 RepID=UPI003A90294B